jgi:hypothetical protein
MEMTDNPKLPQYRSHKVVRAAKILSTGADFVGTEFGVVMVPQNFYARSVPEIGKSYVVIYEDGYISHSPAEAFEGGYTRLP